MFACIMCPVMMAIDNPSLMSEKTYLLILFTCMHNCRYNTDGKL